MAKFQRRTIESPPPSQQGVCVCVCVYVALLPFTLKSILRQLKEELWKLKYFHHAKI